MTRQTNLSHQQWLNIVIIVISALVLLFVMIGRLMERDAPVNSPATTVEVALIRIDFGELEIWRTADSWQSSDSRLSPAQARLYGERWEKLVAQPAAAINDNVGSCKIVLLYFSNLPQPVTVKVSQSASETRFNFVVSDQQVVVAAQDFTLYIPRSN